MINTVFIKEVGALKWIYRTFIRQFYKRVLKRDNSIILPNGLRIQLPRLNTFGSEVFITNANVDWGAENFCLENFPTDGIFLDVGAHIGYYALFLAKRAKQVYCFEPDPRNIDYLKSNISSCGNIRLVQKAVSSEDGFSKFSLGSCSALSSLEINQNNQNIIEVEKIKIDTFRRNEGIKIKGIKIDIEGHDFQALLGAKNTMLEDKPLIITEAMYDDALKTLLDELNYSCYAFTRNYKTRKIKFQKMPSDKEWVTKMLILIHDDNLNIINKYI